jgi:hypothetical protein
MAAEGEAQHPQKTPEVKAPTPQVRPALLRYYLGVPDVKDTAKKTPVNKAITMAPSTRKYKWRKIFKSLPDRNKIDEYKKAWDRRSQGSETVLRSAGLEALKRPGQHKEGPQTQTNSGIRSTAAKFQGVKGSPEMADAPVRHRRIPNSISFTPDIHLPLP